MPLAGPLSRLERHGQRHCAFPYPQELMQEAQGRRPERPGCRGTHEITLHAAGPGAPTTVATSALSLVARANPTSLRRRLPLPVPRCKGRSSLEKRTEAGWDAADWSDWSSEAASSRTNAATTKGEFFTAACKHVGDRSRMMAAAMLPANTRAPRIGGHAAECCIWSHGSQARGEMEPQRDSSGLPSWIRQHWAATVHQQRVAWGCNLCSLWSHGP